MLLAWRNLNHDRLRFLVTVVGIAFAVFLMIFQGSLLVGFTRASSLVLDASDAEIWVTAKGAPCFEFSTPLPARYRDIAMGTAGVTSVQRVTTGAGVWQKPSGMQQAVQIIGAEPGIGSRFPLPFLHPSAGALDYEVVLVDRSNARMLEVDSTGAEVELNKVRARIKVIEDFGSFYGQPYVFTSYAEASRYLGARREDVQLLAVHVDPQFDMERVRAALQMRLPDVAVWLHEQFSRRAQRFWIIQTGAGSALLAAAVLGFIVGVVVVSQNIYATTMENLEEFATLKAMGASRRYVQGIVVVQALLSGLVGAVVGLSVTIPAVRAVRDYIPWVYMPWWLPLGMIGVSLLMCALASVVSVRKAVAVEPGRVFRA